MLIFHMQKLTCNPIVILSSAMSFFPAFKLMGMCTLKLDFEPLPYALPEIINRATQTEENCKFEELVSNDQRYRG